jgi:hypothetical protein
MKIIKPLHGQLGEAFNIAYNAIWRGKHSWITVSDIADEMFNQYHVKCLFDERGFFTRIVEFESEESYMLFILENL